MAGSLSARIERLQLIVNFVCLSAVSTGWGRLLERDGDAREPALDRLTFV
jgi:hypothetical protein